MHQSAAVCARRGEIDAALAFLVAAVVAGFDDAALLEWDPDLATLRNDSRFRAVVERARNATTRTSASSVAAASVPIDLWGDVLAISNDGSRAAVGNSTVVSIVDLGHDRLVAQFAQHGDHPRRIEFSADSGRLWVESESGARGIHEVRTFEYDVATRRRVGERSGPLDALAGFPLASGERFAVKKESIDGATVTRVVDSDSGRELARIDTSDPVQIRAAAVDASATLVRAWGAATVFAVDASTGIVSTPIADAPLQLALTFVGHTRNWVAIRGDGEATVHSFADPTAVRRLDLAFDTLPSGSRTPGTVFIARTDDSGRVLLVMRDFADLAAYSLADGRRLWIHPSTEKAPSVSEFDVGDDSVLIVDGAGCLIARDLETGDVRGRFTPPIQPRRVLRAPDRPNVRSMPDIPPSRRVQPIALARATSSLGDATVRCTATFEGELWIATEPASIHVFRAGAAEADSVIHFRERDPLGLVEIGTLTIAPTGELVVVGSTGYGMAAAYDRATREHRWDLHFGGGNGSAISARFSSDGSWLAICGQSPRNSRIVDARTGTVVLDLGDRGISDLRPVDGASRVFASGDHGVEVLDVPSGRVFSRMFELEDGGLIEHSERGFVFTDATSLARVHRFVGTGSDDLATLAPHLLDIKKIRAASDGVAVTPPVLPE